MEPQMSIDDVYRVLGEKVLELEYYKRRVLALESDKKED